MIVVTKNQALQRWDTLPLVLREALFSEVSSDFLWKTCEAEHIPDEKIYDVARIVGYVLMGFLHPEDTAEELKEQLNLDPKICTSIADAVNGRTFGPLRSEIDKVYEPPSKFGGPKMIQDIGPAPQILSRTTTAAPAISATPLVANQSKVAPTAPPPAAPPPPKAKLPDVGWSRTTIEEPVVKLSQTSTPLPVPASTPRVPPPAVKPTPLPVQGPVGEFERIAIQSKPSAAPAVPPPVILHRDASFKPTDKAPEFHLQLPSDKFGAEKVASQPPVRPAVLELGKTPPPPTPKPSTSTPRVVHYTEYKSPSPEAPIPPASKAPSPVPQGPRQITEVTTPSAPPPQAAMKSPVPTPPSPSPSSPQNKVIYKDYSAPPPPPPPPPLSPSSPLKG
jgi:hypothetical protein